MKCEFAFAHEARPRSRCGLPVIGGGRRCVWHDVDSRPVPFDHKAKLEVELLRPDHWLEGVTLSGGVDLRGLKADRANLPLAVLEDAKLEGAQLYLARLDGAHLTRARLTGAHLARASLRDAYLDDSDLSGANLLGANLSGSDLRGARLDGARLLGVRLDAETLASHVQWGTPGEFREGKFGRAADVFGRLKGHFRSTFDYDNSERFYFLEMTARHLEAIGATQAPPGHWLRSLRLWLPKTGSTTKWLGWALHRSLWGYGTRPLYVLAWVPAVVGFFSILFMLTGINDQRVQGASLPVAVALSLVTFATLGYGNRTPAGPVGEILGGLEGIIGALLLAAFTVALATRYVHSE